MRSLLSSPRRSAVALRRRCPAITGLLGPGVGFVIWSLVAERSGFAAALSALGLDSARAAVVLALLGIAVAVLGTALAGRAALAWASGGAWFGLLFLLPFAGRVQPRLLPGEEVERTRYLLALFALLGMGLAAAGTGAGLGAAVRAGLASLGDRRHWTRRGWMAVALGAFLLAGPATYGVLQSPRILLYGPWAGVVVPAPQISLGRSLGASVASGGSTLGTVVRPAPVTPPHEVVFDYTSSSLGGAKRHALVLLPAGYDAAGRTRYPVLYLLHGSPGKMADWPSAGAGAIVERAYRGLLVPPLIVVFPDGVGPHGGSEASWADNYVPGDLMESDLVRDLVPSVDTGFRTLPNRRFRAVGGLSSGGYGAANLALRNPDIFSLSLVLSASLSVPRTAFGGSTRDRLANSPILLAARPAPADPPLFYVGWGREDALAGEEESFVKQLQVGGYPVRTRLESGGHSWQTFRALLWDALSDVGDRLQPPSRQRS